MGFCPLLPCIHDYYISIVSFSLLLLKRQSLHPMTEHNRHVDYIRIQHVTHVNKGHKTPPTMCLPTYIYIHFWVT